MSKIVKEVSCVVGIYEKDGEKKNRYMRIGSIIETKNGEMLKLDAIPFKDGGWDGWAYLNEPREKGEQTRKPARPSQSSPWD